MLMQMLVMLLLTVCMYPAAKVHCKKRGVTEHPRGAIFYCFRGNSMGYHGNNKILLPWGVPIHRVFYSVVVIIIRRATKHFIQWEESFITYLLLSIWKVPTPCTKNKLILLQLTYIHICAGSGTC